MFSLDETSANYKYIILSPIVPLNWPVSAGISLNTPGLYGASISYLNTEGKWVLLIDKSRYFVSTPTSFFVIAIWY